MNGQTKTDGFHLVLDALRLNGVHNLYGVAGIPITDLLRLAQAEGFRYIGFRHEQQAANAAAIAGYLTGMPGICMTVSAPGFLNGLVGLANATTNCFPMVLISGSSDRNIVDLEQGDYEEMDQLANARPYAKAAYRVNRPEDIGLGVARAIRAAVSGRPGGVYLDLTAEVLGSVLDIEAAKKSLIKVVDPAPAQPPTPESVTRALELLASAERPLVLLGKGAAYARADEEIRSFIETTGLPFLPMSMAKGLLPDNHPQSAAAARSFAIGQADVVLVAGARLNWLLSHGKSPLWSDDTKLIQVDISPTEMDSNRAIAAPVVADIRSAFKAFNAALEPGQIKPSAKWIDDITSRKQKNIDKMAARLKEEPSPMNFSSALRAVRDALAGQPDVYVVNEGANTLDFGRNIIDMFLPRHRLDSGTWGVMGIGMGYAIGAAVETGKPVVALEGDSAFGFSGMEIETICRYELPVVTVIFNNNGIYRGDPAGAAPSPTGFMADARYERIIEAFGGTGAHVTTTAELQKAVSDALASGKPALINAVIDPTAGTESGHIASLNPKSALVSA
ncbi:MAG: oxalyl-CoA decarboxylase [Candidatus Eremiobacteraeota bacterium]|jgi:oxalyl-CoA decarboxylase|nr:oxalyl-CoA decarboxylase [Candidatus Eremiobacteraeota bacterium]